GRNVQQERHELLPRPCNHRLRAYEIQEVLRDLKLVTALTRCRGLVYNDLIYEVIVEVLVSQIEEAAQRRGTELRRTLVPRSDADFMFPEADGAGVGNDGGAIQREVHRSSCPVG